MTRALREAHPVTSPTLEQVGFDLRQLRTRDHANCVVCGSSNVRGLRVNFVAHRDGEVQAEFDCQRAFEGYDGVLHGGVTASLIDGAMTNCLFAQGVSAVTADLSLRYRHPVLVGRSVTVRAWVERSTSRLHLVRAEIVQEGLAKVTASGKFMRRAP